MAGSARPTKHAIAVNAVYTPPEWRRRGYATACVAALSSVLLHRGFDFCVLYTDLSNPTSNAIYTRIGYRPVRDFLMYELDQPSRLVDDLLHARAVGWQAQPPRRIHVELAGSFRWPVAARPHGAAAVTTIAAAPHRTASTHANAPVRVLVYHDMEGLAGQDDWKTFLFSHPEKYPEGQKMLAADLNAVIDGLFAGGATQVDVVDAHGSGNPEPDVRRDLLDQRAKQVFRDKAFDPYVDLTAPNTYDAVVAVAMHAKTGSRGFASHTITLGMDVLLNGKSITESEIVAYSWGRVGVPLIFVSGDDRLQNDLKIMPWLEFVVTKKATSASTVELRIGRLRARRDEGEGGARRAESVEGEGHEGRRTNAGGPARRSAGERSRRSRAFPASSTRTRPSRSRRPTFAPRTTACSALVRAARAGYSSVLVENVRKLPDGKQVMADYSRRAVHALDGLRVGPVEAAAAAAGDEQDVSRRSVAPDLGMT